MSSPVDGEQAWTELSGQVAEFAGELLEGHRIAGPRRLDGPKTIRDSVHGYFLLRPWEVEIADSPLLQRLRYIHQTGLAYYVYPSAHHTRFEHSLGAAKLVSDVVASMQLSERWGSLFSDEIADELRVGALLHDVGHCLFSHVSEDLLQEYFYDQFFAIRQLPRFKGRPAGEILAHALLNSPAVQTFLGQVFDEYKLPHLRPSVIAGFCVGNPRPPDADAYKSELLSGALDVDKLDYLQRDTYSSGIKSQIDTQHIIRSMAIFRRDDGSHVLGAQLAAVSGIEQMHFTKTLLYPAIYHHQKVRALEATVRGICETIREDPKGVPDHLKFQHISDFLRATEYEFLSLAKRSTRVGEQVRNLLNRRVLQRALCIGLHSRANRSSTYDEGYEEFVNLGRNDAEAVVDRDRIRRRIFDALPTHHQTDPARLWLDVPGRPKFKDVEECWVVRPDGTGVPLTDVIPLDRWLKAYVELKWTAHVFYEPEIALRIGASAAAAAVLKDEYDLEFADSAYEEAKVPPPGTR